MSVNFLDESTNFIDFVVEKISIIDLNWIGKIIQWLINGIGIIGIGIIVFTLILKTITMPLDIYSRVKMKKQSLIMKKMRPQMEKLQKQYADDKTMYSQKVMELQKANGISMLSSCLPMIVTLIIFMVVFSAFSTYSQYYNLSLYNGMVDAYNNSVQTFIVDEGGFLIEYEDSSIGEKAYKVDFSAFEKVTGQSLGEKNEAEKMLIVRKYVRENARKKAAEHYRENRSSFLWINSLWYPDSMFNKEVPNFSKFSSSVSRATGSSVDASYEDSYNEVSYYLLNEGYPNHKGKVEGNSYNGYFVLIVLAIGLMFLQQFITMRAQKDADELSSVDGSAARTTKTMMIMMPIIYGIFSFLYSAAFSLYMIVGSVYSLLSTVIINKVMEAKFAKMEENGGFEIKTEIQNKRKRLK